jgi:16S rRNA (guanine1207-N2)-methyltransferase
MVTHKKNNRPAELADLPGLVGSRLRTPLAVVLGQPGEVVPFIAALPGGEVTCYQMDLFPAERLRKELEAVGLQAEVVTSPDLWDLPNHYETVVYPAPKGGERELKIDMVEQAYHLLRPRGTFLVCTPYPTDRFFPLLLKKIFGRVHAPANEAGVFWCQREGERSRRRHEVTFQVRSPGGRSLRFLSRPGVFAYGRLDDGARALMECAVLEAGDRVLDLGCGCGSNGIMAAERTGLDSLVAFVDSNVRALALAECNAQAQGLTTFQTVATSRVEGLPDGGFEVALTNPPYFAQTEIARLFIQRSRALLRPGGRFYLVTKQPKQVAPIIVEQFGETDVVVRRGYTILAARAAGTKDRSALFRLETQVLGD